MLAVLNVVCMCVLSCVCACMLVCLCVCARVPCVHVCFSWRVMTRPSSWFWAQASWETIYSHTSCPASSLWVAELLIGQPQDKYDNWHLVKLVIHWMYVVNLEHLFLLYVNFCCYFFLFIYSNVYVCIYVIYLLIFYFFWLWWTFLKMHHQEES